MEKILAVSPSSYDGDGGDSPSSSASLVSSVDAIKGSTTAPSLNDYDEKPPSNNAWKGDTSTSASALSVTSSIDAIGGSTAAPSLNDYADDEEEEEDVCRICRNPGDTENPLRFPCECRGSIKYVHQDCLFQWLNHSNARQCEVCKYPLDFSPVYAENAPTKLPFQEFIAEIAKKTCHFIRLCFVLSVWFLIIPYINYLVYILAFVRSFGEAQRVFESHISTTNILTDCLYGFLLSFTITTFGGGAFLVWDYLKEQDVDVNENGEGIARLEAQIQQMFNELNDANRADNVPFTEKIGLWGPLFPFVKTSSYILAKYTIFFGVVMFMPLCLGRVILHYLFSKESSNLATIGVGYMVIISLLFLYLGIVELIRYKKGESSIMGRLNLHFNILAYIGKIINMLKLALFSCIGYGAYPLICGWLLDFSTIGMFRNSIAQRINFFTLSPFTSSFIHWLVGNLFMVLLGIFVTLSKEVFSIRIVNNEAQDPSDSNKYLHDLVYESTYEQACTFIVGCALFGSFILMLVFLPVKLATWIAPSIFPLDISVSDVYTEIPALMLLYEMRIPLAIEHFKLRLTLKSFMFTIVYSGLNLTKFLLTRRPKENGSGAHERQNEDINETDSRNVKFDVVGIGHMVLLVIMAWMILLVINTGLIIIPVSLGRALFTAIYFLQIINGIKFNDLYAFIVGSYVMWALIAGVRYCIEQIRSRRIKFLWNNIRKWSVILVNSSALLLIWILVIPVVIGLLIQLLVIVPMRVPLDESPIFLLYQDWALGLISLKIWTTLVIVIPWMDDTWHGKFERVRANGFSGLECIWVLREIIVPILKKLLTALCVPYVLARGVFPVFGFSIVINSLVYRFAWSGCLGFCLVWYFVKRFHVWFINLHNYLRDERYFIGHQLQNFEPQLANQTAASSPESVVGDVFPAIQHEGSI